MFNIIFYKTLYLVQRVTFVGTFSREAPPPRDKETLILGVYDPSPPPEGCEAMPPDQRTVLVVPSTNERSGITQSQNTRSLSLTSALVCLYQVSRTSVKYSRSYFHTTSSMEMTNRICSQTS